MWRTDSFEKPWCWERLKVGGEGDNRGWDGWMASPTQWTWVWVSSGSWWWTGRPGVLQSHGVAKSRTRLSDWNELRWFKSSTCQEYKTEGKEFQKKGQHEGNPGENSRAPCVWREGRSSGILVSRGEEWALRSVLTSWYFCPLQCAFTPSASLCFHRYPACIIVSGCVSQEQKLRLPVSFKSFCWGSSSGDWWGHD